MFAQSVRVTTDNAEAQLAAQFFLGLLIPICGQFSTA
jgi:hypothetical protein